MLKFLTGATVGFVAGAVWMSVGLIKMYKNEGSLAKAEKAIQNGLVDAEFRSMTGV